MLLGYFLCPRSQAVRRRSAKSLDVGSNPTVDFRGLPFCRGQIEDGKMGWKFIWRRKNEPFECLHVVYRAGRLQVGAQRPPLP